MSRILTKAVLSEELPKDIRDAILNGYNVMIRRDVKDGIVSAKVTYYKYASSNKIPICREEDLMKQ